MADSRAPACSALGLASQLLSTAAAAACPWRLSRLLLRTFAAALCSPGSARLCIPQRSGGTGSSSSVGGVCCSLFPPRMCSGEGERKVLMLATLLGDRDQLQDTHVLTARGENASLTPKALT